LCLNKGVFHIVSISKFRNIARAKSKKVHVFLLQKYDTV